MLNLLLRLRDEPIAKVMGKYKSPAIIIGGPNPRGG